jgi:predicted O-methyltransferase YrrM
MTMAPLLAGYGPPTPVPIFQWQPEFETALELYRRLAPKRVLEIGTYHGGTLYHWLQNAQPGALVVSLDSYAAGVDNRALYEDWIPPGVTLEVMAGDSRESEIIAAIGKFAPFDWIFIDAGHYLDEVTDDWNNYGPMAAEGGVVLFHDILPPSRSHPEIEVSALWSQIRQTHRTLDIIHDCNAEWGGIGVVLT